MVGNKLLGNSMNDYILKKMMSKSLKVTDSINQQKVEEAVHDGVHTEVTKKILPNQRCISYSIMIKGRKCCFGPKIRRKIAVFLNSIICRIVR